VVGGAAPLRLQVRFKKYRFSHFPVDVSVFCFLYPDLAFIGSSFRLRIWLGKSGTLEVPRDSFGSGWVNQ